MSDDGVSGEVRAAPDGAHCRCSDAPVETVGVCSICGLLNVRLGDVIRDRKTGAALEIETVTTQTAEDAIEEALAAHDVNTLASIAHTLRITLEAAKENQGQ